MKKLPYIMLGLLIALTVGVFSNDFYSHTSGTPATGAQGSSATMRAEFDSIVTGFDKLPTLTANGNLPIFVNAGGTALAATSASTARTNLGVTATGADTTYAFRANNLSDLSNAATARTNLGLGSISTQAANSVAITGGSITGITDLAVADGGTGASTAANARTNLGAAASGANSDITSITGITGDLTSTKPCATNYSRISPNYCAWTAYGFAFPASLSTGTTCQESAALTGVTSAKAVVLLAEVNVFAQNSVGSRVQTGHTYADSDSSCASQGASASANSYEQAAVSGTSVTINFQETLLIIPSTTTGRYRFNSQSATSVGDVQLKVMGYIE